MINPLSDKQFKQLHESIVWSERQLEKPRLKRVENISQFVGYHYSDHGTDKRIPVSFIKLAVNIFSRLLAPKAPRALITTKEDWLKPTAAALELAVNEIPGEIDLQTTMKALVIEALFSCGWVKVGLHRVGEILGHDFGEPFVDIVTLDDIVIDMGAKSPELIQYIGNTYWLDYEEVMDSPWFPKKNKTDLKSDEYKITGDGGERRAEGISVDGSVELFRKKIQLRDIWLPKERLMVTYGVQTKRRLKVFKLDSPEQGPYLQLAFDRVPGNILPLPPVLMWRDLHDLANSLFRKLGDEADAQKTVLGFSSSDDEAVTNFKNAKDGDGIVYPGQEPKTLKAGGIEPNTLAFFLQVKDLTSYFALNLDSLGGLSPQAETLGQEKLLSEATGAQMRDMAAEVIAFSKKLFKTLAYYEWHDVVRDRQLEKSIPGTDISIAIPWNRQSRLGKFEQYNLDIDVYSLQDDSPSLKLQKLFMMLERLVFPLMPAIQQQGGSLDAQKILQIAAKYADFQELNDIVLFMEQNQEQLEEQGKMPLNTTRTYERINRPGATERGKSQILQQALLGGRPQEAEMAAIGRSTG